MAETRTLSSSPSLTLLRTEGQLRNKIKELHEKRAAGLMSEIAQLQKEKSISNSQIKNLGSIITDLRKENAFMKQKEKEFVAKIQSLERLLLEEKLIVENYKAKYKSLDKKNKELLKKLDNRRSTELSTGLSPLKGGDRSSSLSNLSQMNMLVDYICTSPQLCTFFPITEKINNLLYYLYHNTQKTLQCHPQPVLHLRVHLSSIEGIRRPPYAIISITLGSVSVLNY